MQDSGYNFLKDQADAKLSVARQELNKLHFDAQKTCANCRSSMIDYLNAYLIHHGVQPRELQTIAVLLEQCKDVDPGFNELDISAINCRYELVHRDPCTTRDKLDKCYETTQNVKSITE